LEAEENGMVNPKKYPIVSRVCYEIMNQEKAKEVNNKTATGEKRNRVSPPPIRA
jgi:hypothetical protein